MITSKDLVPVVTALESINVKGSADIGTMNNIFQYLVKLGQAIDQENEERAAKEKEADEVDKQDRI